MFGNNKKALFSSLAFFSLLPVSSIAASSQHIVIAPDCLLGQVTSSYKVLAKEKSLSLAAVNQAQVEQLIAAKNIGKNLCGGFMDVTYAWNKQHGGDAKTFLTAYTNQENHARKKSSYEIKYQKQVEQMLGQLNPQEMWDYLSTLTSFQDRYADSDNGVKAAEWLKSQVETFARDNQRTDVSVYTITTGGYKQPSVVAKVGSGTGPGIVIGAHMDTLSSRSSKKPGADDDGTGSVTVLEAARTVLASGMQFKKPVYFVWYAAEEEGLVGSGYVVDEFKNKNIPVTAVLHYDLTGFAHNNESTMWLIDDYVDKSLSSYLGDLIKAYVKKPIKHTSCGYACSDHANWTANGYAAAIPAESAYEDTNPYIHSSMDTMDKLSLDHMTDYVKLAAAFVVEMAEPLA